MERRGRRCRSRRRIGMPLILLWLTTMLTHMHIIRAFEETALEFAGRNW